MNMNESKASNALGAKTARPCDSCLIKRARWFCAADDAFLCHSCDAAVHSANQLATRHQRLRLETSSCKPAASSSPPPAWHHGFTKKARTPRQPKAPPRHHLPLVPELGADDPFPEENEEQLFCRVPVFDAFADEFGAEGVGSMVFDDDHEACRELNLEELLELGGCEAELAEFAADVESLLGSDSATGVVDDIDDGVLMDGKRVKSEEEDDDDDEVGAVIASHFDPALDMEMNWDFDSTIVEEETKKEELEKEELEAVKKGESSMEMEMNERKKMLLRLNYEAVIAAWATQGCPWTDGIRPQFDLDEFMVIIIHIQLYN